MGNTYFQFKQFKIDQADCPMKVSTEACILGAWVDSNLPNRILDIGTGTGLLCLMLAQRMECPIDAVELDQAAANQASNNVAHSPWSDRIQIFTGNVFEWAKNLEKKYDLIVSNPPFFANHLQSNNTAVNTAKHDGEGFDKPRFAQLLKDLLSGQGTAYILYPEYEFGEFRAVAKAQGLYCEAALIIRNQPNKSIFRIIGRVSKVLVAIDTETLHIRDGNAHTDEFNALLKEYYLKL